MSKRERMLALAVIALIGVLALDQLAIRPMLSRYDQLTERRRQLESEIRNAQMLLENREAIEARWDAMTRAGLTNDASAQRIAVQRRLSEWAEGANFNLATVSTARTTPRDGFEETRFIATGAGSLDALAGFLARLEQSDYPLRVLETDVTSRDDRGDELALRVTLSSIRRAETPATPTEEARP